jgi:hypothetical protein
VTRRLEHDTLLDQSTALAVFGGYCVATAATTPIPTFIYERNSERIARAWDAAT